MNAVTVVGAGGIGVAVGYALRVAGWNVSFVETNPAKLVAGRRDGIAVVGREPLDASFIAFDDWRPNDDALTLLCTKCYDNAAVLSRLSAVGELVPVQNGFDATLDQQRHPVEGIASFVSECAVDKPVTRITRPGDLHLGFRHADRSPTRDRLAEAFETADLFTVQRVERIQPFKYAKLMYNAAISPLAASAGIDNGDLLALPVARRLFFALLQENYRVLTNAGVELERIGPLRPATVAKILRQRWLARLLAFAFTPSLRGTYCSMAPDLPKGRTEIGYYNRHLIDIAGATPCPINRAVVALIERMEVTREAPRTSILDELARSLG